MLTAKNYAAQVESRINFFIKKTKNKEKFLNFIPFVISRAQHFSTADNGRILDDNLKGIRNTDVRLPFKRITLEYYDKERDKKMVIIALEIENNDENKGFYHIGNMITDERLIVIFITGINNKTGAGRGMLPRPKRFNVLPSKRCDGVHTPSRVRNHAKIMAFADCLTLVLPVSEATLTDISNEPGYCGILFFRKATCMLFGTKSIKRITGLDFAATQTTLLMPGNSPLTR